jgi:hypothetical protein
VCKRQVLNFFDAQRLRYGRHHQVWITDRGKRNEVDAVREVRSYISCYLCAEAGLADAGWANQGEEAHLRAAKHLDHSGYLLLSTYEGSRLSRQVVAERARLDRLRWLLRKSNK